ncbi:MAG: transglycosylase SLT domain-containing protein [Gemmatimonadaceae bacterium]|nr:transglycosylase SLT domain-containing protein [Gemmatimonadaceae bacterium]
MTRYWTTGLATWLWTSTACAQTEPRTAARAVEVDLARTSGERLTGDPLAASADSLIRAGRPWRATVLLAGKLGTPASASPELRLAGARAAQGWDGWTEVERLLRDAPWLDARFGGEGRELLARSALERGQDASSDARQALAAARDDAARVVRRVLLARVYDRANQSDSAAAGYRAGAASLPSVADWLQLRAAGVTSDSATRAALFARVKTPAARARIAFTDAQARERSGDLAGAARVYRSVGAEGSAFRAEALAARDDAAKGALATRIATYLERSQNATEVRQSLEVLDKLAITLPIPQELIAARAAAAYGTAGRAVAGFDRATRAGAALSASDRLLYAGALLRAGRAREAMAQYGGITGTALAPLASYQRARALLQAGDGAGARAALRQTATTYATRSDAAAPALLLLADLQVDDGDLAGAARTLDELGARHAGSAQAPLGRFRAGLLAFASDPRRAAALFDTLVQRYPKDDEAIAARYWAARADERVGRRAESERRWREIIAASPLSYYAQLSARRLHTTPWMPPTGPDTVPHIPGVDSAVARIAVLDRLGMDVESRFELDALADRAERNPADAAAVAQALVTAGDPSRALRVAVKALDTGVPSRALLRAAYPVVHADALVEESRRNGLDPALVAGLVRQESAFNPKAVSAAGARGLMQLMPPVGASIAATHRFPIWSPVLLLDPDVSLELGTAHLATSLTRDTPPARALAAYNAGGSRVARWIQRPGSDDPELFAEWIPYTETRDYVRVVQRNAEIYRALYRLTN